MKQSNQGYMPGLCNIGPREIARRQLIGWWGLAATIVLWGSLYVLEIPRVWQLLLFFPASLSAIGFLQASFRFCATFGLKGLFNLGPELGSTESIKEIAYREIDRRRAWKIIFTSTLIGVAVALLGYYS